MEPNQRRAILEEFTRVLATLPDETLMQITTAAVKIIKAPQEHTANDLREQTTEQLKARIGKLVRSTGVGG